MPNNISTKIKTSHFLVEPSAIRFLLWDHPPLISMQNKKNWERKWRKKKR